jgi:hypothetical protein
MLLLYIARTTPLGPALPVQLRATGFNAAHPTIIPRMTHTYIILAHPLCAVLTVPISSVLWNLYPERPLGPPQAVTKISTKGHEDDSKPTTDFLKESTWAAMMSTQMASGPLLGQTRGSMSINQIPADRLVYAGVHRLPDLPEDAGVMIGSHRLVYVVFRDRYQTGKLPSERCE